MASFTRFLDHTQRRTTVGRTPLDEWSARRRDLYLTTHNPHSRQTFMPPVGFEPTISAGERPHTYALDRAATGTGHGLTCILELTTEGSIFASFGVPLLRDTNRRKFVCNSSINLYPVVSFLSYWRVGRQFHEFLTPEPDGRQSEYKQMNPK